MSFLDAVKASNSDLLYLVRGKESPSGEDAWYYVLLESKMKAPIFLKKLKTGLDINDYGKILYSGWGKEPPEHIRAKIKEQFG